MISSHVASDFSEIKLSHFDWKQYNIIKKKAMEQEFSWSGLILSLSIAFFIVIMSAYLLSSFYSILELNSFNFTEINNSKIYFESLANTQNGASFINMYL